MTSFILWLLTYQKNNNYNNNFNYYKKKRVVLLVFIIREGIIDIKYNGEILFILCILGTLFFLTFISNISLLLFTIYNQGNSNEIELKYYEQAVKMLNLIVYIIVFIMISYEIIFSQQDIKSLIIPYSKTHKVVQLFFALIYLYINRDEGYYINSFSKFKYKYGKIIIFSMFYFMIRSIFTITSVFTPIESHHGIIEIISYSLLEIFPILLLLWVTKKLEYEAIELKNSIEEPDIISPIIDEKI
ncbi:hypothetical protein ACTFIU_007178 [Dictyostelium citrinum]